MQKIFFKRGIWNKMDLLPSKMVGLQILNGSIDDIFYKSMLIWKQLLLSGIIKYIYAGNDAHGNFNIYRQISIPMFSIKEKKDQIFGYFRTGVITGKARKSVETTIENLRKGNCFITNGPLLKISFFKGNKIYNMGSTAIEKEGIIKIQVKSSFEYGKIKNIVLKRGIIGHKKEINQLNINNINKYEINYDFKIYTSSKCYYRCEAEFIKKEKENVIALTNPIWLNPN
jgi:hypothetical protein